MGSRVAVYHVGLPVGPYTTGSRTARPELNELHAPSRLGWYPPQVTLVRRERRGKDRERKKEISGKRDAGRATKFSFSSLSSQRLSHRDGKCPGREAYPERQHSSIAAGDRGRWRPLRRAMSFDATTSHLVPIAAVPVELTIRGVRTGRDSRRRSLDDRDCGLSNRSHIFSEATTAMYRMGGSSFVACRPSDHPESS